MIEEFRSDPDLEPAMMREQIVARIGSTETIRCTILSASGLERLLLRVERKSRLRRLKAGSDLTGNLAIANIQIGIIVIELPS